jgi:hypothetical protein
VSNGNLCAVLRLVQEPLKTSQSRRDGVRAATRIGSFAHGFPVRQYGATREGALRSPAANSDWESIVRRGSSSRIALSSLVDDRFSKADDWKAY